jgi:arginine repressor
MNVEIRVRKYLENDKNGIRRELLLIFLDGRKHTSDEIYEILKAKGYEINKKSVSAMLGVVSSKLGIVKTELGEKKKYYIKSEYADLVERAVKASL